MPRDIGQITTTITLDLFGTDSDVRPTSRPGTVEGEAGALQAQITLERLGYKRASTFPDLTGKAEYATFVADDHTEQPHWIRLRWRPGASGYFSPSEDVAEITPFKAVPA